MTVAKFLEGCAEIFERKTIYRDLFMARQCRDYAVIALNLEEADRLRREDETVALSVRVSRERAAERAARKADPWYIPPVPSDPTMARASKTPKKLPKYEA